MSWHSRVLFFISIGMNKISPLLFTRINYPELSGVMSKQHFIQKAFEQGWRVTKSMLDGYSDGRFKRTTFNRLAGDEQVAYENKMKQKRAVYSIQQPGTKHFYDISKAEYVYFRTLANAAFNTLPDTKTTEDGYQWEVLTVSEEDIRSRYNAGVALYKLYDDDSEALIETAADIAEALDKDIRIVIAHGFQDPSK